MLVVFSTNNPVEFSLAQSLLSDAGISAHATDVYTSNVEGSIGIFPKRLMVLEKDFEAARAILLDGQLLDE